MEIPEEETRRVLEMLRQGKITPEEAAILLDALEADPQPEVSPPRGARRTLRINVTDTRTGRARVNVSIPLGLVELAGKMGLTMGMKSVPELADIHFDEIMTAIKSGVIRQIVEIEDDDDRQRVVVSVE